MSEAPPPPPPSGGAPRFRIVPGRGLGERPSSSSNSSSNQQTNEPRIPHVQSSPQVQQMAVQQPQPQVIELLQQQPQIQQPQPSDSPTTPQPPIQPQSVVQIQAVPTPPTPQQQQPMDEQVVMKCVRFFKTLINLSQQPEQQQEGQSQRVTAARVHDLVSNVIFGNMPAEEFTQSLQAALRSQAQPHLLPFLQRTLPHLREAIRAGEMVIDGISPPPGFISASPPPSISSSNVPSPLAPQSHPMSSQPTPQLTPGQPQIPVSQQSLPIAMAPQHPQSQPPPGAAQEVRVQEMEGVEEGRPEEEVIQVRQLQESPLKSALLRPMDIMNKITERMKEACYVEEEVLTLISDAAEYRLREILAELTVLAEHRMDPIRMNPNYGPIDNTKGQIRFIEDLDRQQQEQSENRAKEELIRMSKGKGIGKDTIEKAKEMQRADAEAKRNRDANAAAIAALSSKSAKPKWDSVAPGGGGHVSRPRTIRVNIRDLHLLVNNDYLCSKSQLVHKLALGGGVQTENI